MEALADLPSADGLTYDPLPVIRAVNHVVGLGPKEGHRALRATASEGALLVARVAYVPVDPTTPLPRLELGRPDVEEAKAAPWFPLFPLALHGDIPFLIVAGYYRGGETDPSSYFDWCELHGRLREPLQPDSDPVAAAADLCASEAWAALEPPPSHTKMVRAQALRMAPGDSAPSI